MSADDSRRGLIAWMLLLWGPLLWFAHFGTVYAATSVELTLRPIAGLSSRIAIAVATLLALMMVAGGWIRAGALSPGAAGSDLHRFWVSATRILCLISGVAIVYQTLPALLVP